MKKELTPAEEAAVRWAKAYYPHCWRKHFGTTREQHNARCPLDFRDARAAWDGFYLAPFGDEEMNWNVRTVRRLLAEKSV